MAGAALNGAEGDREALFGQPPRHVRQDRIDAWGWPQAEWVATFPTGEPAASDR